MDLEPIDPETALELYISEKEAEMADATVHSHRSRLKHVVRWCEEREIDNLNDLTGRKLHEFRLWRRNGGDLAKGEREDSDGHPSGVRQVARDDRRRPPGPARQGSLARLGRV